jgi:hypothetical protein
VDVAGWIRQQARWQTQSTVAGKSACCGIFSKNGTLPRHESDFHREAQAFFTSSRLAAAPSHSWTPTTTGIDRKRTRQGFVNEME